MPHSRRRTTESCGLQASRPCSSQLHCTPQASFQQNMRWSAAPSVMLKYCAIDSAGKASNSLCSEIRIAFPSGPESLMLRKGVKRGLDLPILNVRSGCSVLMSALLDNTQDQPQPAAMMQRWWGPHKSSLTITRRLCRPSCCNGTSAESRGRTSSRALPQWVPWTDLKP